MVIFKLFTGIVKIGWVRVIYDGSGNFQVFSGFLWPKLRVPHCKLQWIREVSIRPHFNFMREGRLVSNLLVVSVVVIQQECRQKSRGSFSFLSRCVLCFQFYPPCVGRFQFIPQ